MLVAGVVGLQGAVSEHIETLYEMDVLFAGMAREAGVRGFHRVAALNSSPLFLRALADIVEPHLEHG